MWKRVPHFPQNSTVEFLKKFSTEPSYNLANFTLRETPKRNENVSIQKLVHKFHSHIFVIIKKWK